MKKSIKKTKWLQFLIAMTAITIPVASGGLLVVACSNTDEQIQKQKADLQEFATAIKPSVKDSTYSVNVIMTVFNSDDFDLFNNDFIDFQTPENRSNYDFSAQATNVANGNVRIFITITNKQNTLITNNISFEFPEFPHGDSPQDETYVNLYTVMSKLKLTKKPANKRVVDAVQDINNATFNPLVNDIFSMDVPANLQTTLALYTPTATAVASQTSNTSIDIDLKLTSKSFTNISKTVSYPMDGFVYVSPIELEQEKLTQYINSLNLSVVDHNLTLYDALQKVNAADFDIYSNDVFSLSDPVAGADFIFTPIATEASLTTMEVQLTITSKNYKEVSETKTFTLGDFVDGRISETQKINDLQAKFTIQKRTDASGKSLTVAEALKEIAAPTFNIYNNKVFTISDAIELQKYDLTINAEETSITSITINFTLTSRIYSDIRTAKSFVLVDFIDPKVTEANKIQALINKVAVAKTELELTQKNALTEIQSDGFNVLDNPIFTLTYQNEDITPYTFSLASSRTKGTTAIEITLKITSNTYSDVNKTKVFTINGFIEDTAEIEAEKALLKELMDSLAITKKSTADALGTIAAVEIINGGVFNVLNNEVFTVTPTIDTAIFNVTALATKTSDTSLSVTLTIKSIKFATDVVATKVQILGNFAIDDPKAAETIRINKFISALAITKIANQYTVDEALASIAKPTFNLLNNDVFTMSPTSTATGFDFTTTAVKSTETEIAVTIAVTSQAYSELTQSKPLQLSGFVNPKTLEIQKLQTLIDDIVISKNVLGQELTVVQALAAITEPTFNVFDNNVFIVSEKTRIEEFNYQVSATKVSDTEIKVALKLTSKTYSDVTLTKEQNLTGFNNKEILEQQKLNALMAKVAVTKTATTLTANQALAEINKAGFNIFSNTVFSLTPAADAQMFDVALTNKKIQNSNDIKLSFKFTSKTYPATVSATKDFILASFKTEMAAESEKLVELMKLYSFTKKTSEITADAAVSQINTTGFNIYQNDIYTITPATENAGFTTKLAASKTTDTTISLSLTLTSKLFSGVTQTKVFSLSDFTPPITEGVVGTGINKIYTDKSVGAVYIGTAENYMLGGKNFYGDQYILNPFQDYGQEELDLMQADATWPQIKQLVASSRPVSGTPNLDAYLPNVGTPITFTDEIKSSTNLPSNVKRFISIVDEPKYNEFFYYRNAVYSYREFLKAIAKYPRILAEVNLDASFVKNNDDLKINGVLSPEKALAYVAKLEITTMFSHFMQETNAGMGVFSDKDGTLIKQNRPKQIPWNSNYSASYTEPTSPFTNLDIATAATGVGVTLANQTEMLANPTAKMGGTEKQALYWVTEATFITDDTTEAARNAYTAWNLASVPWTAAAFPVPLGTDGISTVSYIGRGAKQLSWNYNYGPASRVFFGDDEAEVLLNDPSRVAKEGWLAIGTAIMFYMTPSGNKPSMHDAITGAWEPTAEQQSNFKWKPGFGLSINIINGGYEIISDGTEANQTYQALNRQFFFAQNAKALGILDFASSSYFDNAGYGQTLFSNATSVPTVSTNWAVSWEGAPSASLATWDTGAGFKVNFPGDYYRTWKAYQNSTFIADWGITTDKAFAVKSADWKAGKNPSYTKVGPNYDWKSK